MKKIRNAFIFSTILVLAACTAACAVPVHPEAGTTGAAFLKIGLGARPASMGEAFSAVADDIYAIYWNPAGLIQFEGTQITGTHAEWFQNIRHEFIAFSSPLSKDLVFAMSIFGLYMTDLEKRSWSFEAPEADPTSPESKFASYDIAGTAACGYKFSEKFNAGIGLKVIYERIDDYNAWDFAADIGGIYRPWADNLQFGLVVQNIGPKLKFIEKSYWLPVNLKFGTAFRIPEWNFLLALDINQSIDDYMTIDLGAEEKITEFLALRAGYKYKWFGNDLGALSGLTAGIGFKLYGYHLDYGFAPYGDLGLTHRISFTIVF